MKPFWEMIKESLKGKVPKLKGKAVLAGMGGSGIAGRIWSDISDEEFLVVSDYSPPPFIRKPWKFISSSYSGNTEEVISCTYQMLERGMKGVAMASGGRLEEMAKEAGIPLVKLPAGLPPRFAFPYSFSYLARMFGKDEELRRAANLIRRMDASAAEEIASSLKGRIPVFIGHTIFRSVAYRMATQVNENAKYPAFHHELPEMNHNLVTGLERGKGKVSLVFIRHKNEPPAVRDRIEITKSLLKHPWHEIWAKGRSRIEKVLSAVYLGDMLSMRLAELYRVDPIRIKVIEELKRRLKERRTLARMLRYLKS